MTRRAHTSVEFIWDDRLMLFWRCPVVYEDVMLWGRCYKCGHWLLFMATGCPQCGEHFDARKQPKRWPTKCQCERCASANPQEQVEWR